MTAPSRPDGLRVLVIGTSGSGKSTFAQRLAERARIAYHELDLINWRPGWFDRHHEEPEAFLADVDAATSGPDWTISGGYSVTRPIIIPRLTDLVWLDLPHWLVMAQVIRRSVLRAASNEDVFPGCREDWPRLLKPDHPIRWALATHNTKRPKFAAQAEAARNAGAQVHICQTRGEIEAALDLLAGRKNNFRSV